MSFQVSQLSKWFTPPIVVPLGLGLLLAGYILYKNFV